MSKSLRIIIIGLVMFLFALPVQANDSWPELRMLLSDKSEFAITVENQESALDYSFRVNYGANLSFHYADTGLQINPAFYFSGPFAFANTRHGWEVGYVNEDGSSSLEMAGVRLGTQPIAFLQLKSGDSHLYLDYSQDKANPNWEFRFDLAESFMGFGSRDDFAYLDVGYRDWSVWAGLNSASGEYQLRLAKHWQLLTWNPFVREEFTEVSFYAQDKVRLFANWYQGSQPNKTLVIMLNGFGSVKGQLNKDQLAKEIAKLHDVLVLDFRGHGHSSGYFTGTNAETLDVQAALRFASQKGYEHIAVVGFSMGGTIALKSAAVYSNSIDAVITVSAPMYIEYDHPEYLTQKITGVAVQSVPFTVRNISGLRTIPPDLASNLDLRDKIALVHQPLLVIHAENDWLIPADDAFAIFDGASSERKELVILPAGFHSEFISNRMFEEVSSLIMGWLAEMGETL